MTRDEDVLPNESWGHGMILLMLLFGFVGGYFADWASAEPAKRELAALRQAIEVEEANAEASRLTCLGATTIAEGTLGDATAFNQGVRVFFDGLEEFRSGTQQADRSALDAIARNSPGLLPWDNGDLPAAITRFAALVQDFRLAVPH